VLQLPPWRWRWRQKGGKDQSARLGVRLYEIKKTADGYRATVTVDDGNAAVLSETSFAKGYAACIAHAKATVAAAERAA
jgi:hypothetical protein